MYHLKRLFRFIIIGSLVFSLSSFDFAVKASADPSSISYLQALPPDAWNTMALAAAGVPPHNLEHLRAVSGDKATDYAKAALAITAAGHDPRTFGQENLVRKFLQDFFINDQIGQASLLNDDFWSILALRSAGVPSSHPVITASRQFILEHQNVDGGWSYGVGLSSDTNDTAVAVMSLLEAGVSDDDAVIQHAKNYLHSAQNPDGGFPFSHGGVSDAGSDAWVISMITKLGEDPETWIRGNNTPISHLRSLQMPNGSFRWLESDPREYPIMTSYAVIALSEKSFPVNRISAPDDPGNQDGDDPEDQTSGVNASFRIEGAHAHICEGDVIASTAMDVIKNTANPCGFRYEIIDTEWGPYLQSINDDTGLGLSGWMYLVNWKSPLVGAAEYILQERDTVLWFFGKGSDTGHRPTRITADRESVKPGESFRVNVEYYDDGAWGALPSGILRINNEAFTITEGASQVTLSNPGVYRFAFEASEEDLLIRSNPVSVSVGVDAFQEVDLRVNVTRPEIRFQPAIAFTVSASALDFQNLEPGQSRSKELVLSNIGNVNIRIEADITDDELFTSAGNVTLNQTPWQDFSVNIASKEQREITSTLSIPANYQGVGMKQGKIIFWATQQ